MNFVKKGSSYHYTFSFEEIENFPLGVYRFHVNGWKWDGSKRVAYQNNTDSFSILPSQKIKVWDVTFDGKSIHAWASYPAGTNDDGHSAFSKLKATSFRLRSPLVRWEVGPPLAAGKNATITAILRQKGKEILKLHSDTIVPHAMKAQHIAIARDENGKEVRKTINALSSGFVLSHKKKLPAGSYELTLSIQDSYGNSGVWGPSPVTVK